MRGPKRLMSDDEAKQALEMQRLRRIGEVIDNQTIVRGDASAMGKAEDEYLKGLIVELRDHRDDIVATKSAAKAESVEKARVKRQAKAAASTDATDAPPKRKRKRSNAAETESSSSSSSPLTSDGSSASSSSDSSPQASKKRKSNQIDAVMIETENDDEPVDENEYVSLCNNVRSTLDHSPTIGAMRIRVKWIRQAKRSISQWANWKVTSINDNIIKVRRSDDTKRHKKLVNRALIPE